MGTIIQCDKCRCIVRETEDTPPEPELCDLCRMVELNAIKREIYLAHRAQFKAVKQPNVEIRPHYEDGLMG